jgi:hypothetical protein
MSLWIKYLKKRELREGLGDTQTPVDKFKFNSKDDDVAQDHEHIQQELFKAVIGKYPNETMDFFQTLANRGDEEIASLLKKVTKEKSSRLPFDPQHPSDGDEYVPSSADIAHNPESGGGGE